MQATVCRPEDCDIVFDSEMHENSSGNDIPSANEVTQNVACRG